MDYREATEEESECFRARISLYFRIENEVVVAVADPSEGDIQFVTYNTAEKSAHVYVNGEAICHCAFKKNAYDSADAYAWGKEICRLMNNGLNRGRYGY